MEGIFENNLTDIVKPENLVYQKSSLMTDRLLTFCPGCGHGTIIRLIMEVIEEMGIQQEVIGVGPVGCSVLMYEFIDIDFVSGPHGRAAAVATGLKRVLPDKLVFSYQGDGDLAAIGTGESLHACNRGENISMFFINNGIYGMTGGQMAPTTIPGMKTSTSPYGRDISMMGPPLKFSNIVADLDGTCYVTRQAVHTPAHVRKAKKAIRIAFDNQLNNKGTSFVEFLSNCNSGWKMSPVQANHWMEKNMFPHYPLGDIKVDGKKINQTPGNQ